MWRRLRDSWIPQILFAGALFVAGAILAVVIAMPYVLERLTFTHPLLVLFADDATVRRSSVAAAIGLIVTAFVFFRPSSAPPRKTAKRPADTIVDT